MEMNPKKKGQYLLRKPQTPMILNCCLLLKQRNKQPVKTIEKFFKLRIVECFHLSVGAVKKNYSMSYSEIENNVLQS